MDDRLTKLIAECFGDLDKEESKSKSTIVVNIPEGYEIDNEESNFDENGFSVKFKKKEVKFRGSNAPIKGFYINNASIIYSFEGYESSEDKNVFHTKKQAESALAMAQISQIMANDKRFGGIITNKEWEDDDLRKYAIIRFGKGFRIDTNYSIYQFLAFHTREQAELFLQENSDLVKQYLML